MIYRMIVVCSTGREVVFYRCRINCTFEEYTDGEHYARAKEMAAVTGYQNPMIPICCEYDLAGAIVADHFDWKDTPEFTV